MTEETKNGIAEAFSFRKGVVKISGQWIRFGKEMENSIKGISVGDSVSYTVEGRNLKRIEKLLDQPASPKPAKPTPATPSSDSRNRSIERQVALKAAVELAELYGYSSTKECLDVAASFAAWIEDNSSDSADSRPESFL
jgi:hypothetical protein